MELRIVPASEFGQASLGALLDSLVGVPEPIVGLATGNSPLPLYRELRIAVGAGTVSVQNIWPFAIDEYGGSQNHPCSNRAFFAEHWEAIPGSALVEQFDQAAPDGALEIARLGVLLTLWGGLDVAILGIGVNGHLAFNEPGSGRDSVSRLVSLTETTRESAHACWGGATPTHGLTLGLAEILGARRVLLLVNGAAKAEILQRALEGPVSAACPASFLQEHPALTVVADDAAAPLGRPGGTHAKGGPF